MAGSNRKPPTASRLMCNETIQTCPLCEAVERLSEQSLGQQRRDACRRMHSIGWPTRKQEAWRYCDFKEAESTPWKPAPPSTLSQQDLDDFAIDGTTARLVFVNGRFDATHSSPLPDGVHYIWGTGRRKRAVARVRIRPGSGKILINKREPAQYFPSLRDQNAVVRPLETSQMMASWDVWVNVGGGGTTGQADAVSLGLARALSKAMPELDAGLRKDGLMTRDARKVERKKYGQRGARRRFQFSKR